MATTKYIWDSVIDACLVETDGSDTAQAVFTNEPTVCGQLVSVRRSSTTHFCHFDASKSTRQLTAFSKTTSDSWVYDGWGNEKARAGTTTQTLTWAGQLGYQYDSEITLFYVRHRSYAPHIARWQSIDPLQYLEGPNYYLAVLNNPVRYTDPLGLRACPPGFDQHHWFPQEHRDKLKGLCGATIRAFDLVSGAISAIRSAGPALESNWIDLFTTCVPNVMHTWLHDVTTNGHNYNQRIDDILNDVTGRGGDCCTALTNVLAQITNSWNQGWGQMGVTSVPRITHRKYRTKGKWTTDFLQYLIDFACRNRGPQPEPKCPTLEPTNNFFLHHPSKDLYVDIGFGIGIVAIGGATAYYALPYFAGAGRSGIGAGARKIGEKVLVH